MGREPPPPDRPTADNTHQTKPGGPGAEEPSPKPAAALRMGSWTDSQRLKGQAVKGCRARDVFAEYGPSLLGIGQCWPKSAIFGRNQLDLVETGQLYKHWPKCGRNRPRLVNSRPRLAELGASLVELGPKLQDSRPVPAMLGKVWPILAESGSKLAGSRPNPAPKLAEVGQNSVRSGPNLTGPGPSWQSSAAAIPNWGTARPNAAEFAGCRHKFGEIRPGCGQSCAGCVARLASAA